MKFICSLVIAFVLSITALAHAGEPAAAAPAPAAKAQKAAKPAKPPTAAVSANAPVAPEQLTEAEALKLENFALRAKLLEDERARVNNEIVAAHHIGPTDKLAQDGRTIIRGDKK